MTQRAIIAIIAVGTVSLFGCVESGGGSTTSPPPPAVSPPVSQGGLSDFVGARAGQAEGGLQARGYELDHTEGLTAYWFKAETGECVEIVTADGRYASVTPVSPGECEASGTGAAAAPSAAEQACLAAVSSETNNGDVSLIDSSFSEAGTLVHVAVGPDRAVWQCIAYRDGSTDGVQFTGSEGAL